MKRCSKCGLEQSLDGFYNSSNTKDGKQGHCKQCCKASFAKFYEINKERLRKERKEYAVAFRKAHPDRMRDIDHRRRHKEPYEEKIERLKEQNYMCANPGCENYDPGPFGWHTDHNHLTGEIRGELCSSCNTALGMLAENKDRITGLVRYLEFYETPLQSKTQG